MATFKIDTSRLPDQETPEKGGAIDFSQLPDQVQAPGDLLPTQDREGMADDHLDFFSFGMEPSLVASQKEHINGKLASDESAQNLKSTVKTRMIDIQRRRQPEIRRAPEKTLWEEVDGYFRHIFGMKEADIAEANIALEARERGVTVEEFKRQLVPEGEGLRRVERFFSGAGAGAVGTIEGMAGSVQWITEGEFGQDLANQAQIWRSEMVPSAEERDFSDDVASGVGSMAVFFIPGLGVANGTRLLFGASTRLAAWAGTGVMTAMEASTEAGMVYRDVIRETGSKTKAEDAATTTFWLNVPLITITNKLAFFTEGGSVLSRAARGGALEGTQEAGQEVISGMATGDTPKMGDLARAFGVGAITGGGVGLIQSLSEDKTDTDLTERDNEFIESFQTSLQGVTEEAEAIAVEEGKPVAQEQFEEIIATEVTDEQVVNQLLGELEVAAEGIVEEDTPQRLANAIGKPNQIDVLESIGVTGEQAQINQIVRDEVQSKLDTADAFEARGDTEQATRLREEARQAGETLKEADGIDTERTVDSVLGGEEVGKALTELEQRKQEEAATELREKAEKIEADIVATLAELKTEEDPLPQLEELGNIAFDEGATDIETFTERMKAKLGNLWERFRGFIQTVFDKLKEERGAIEFGKESVKQRIRRLTGQTKEGAALIREDDALKISLKKQEQAAKKATKEAKKELLAEIDTIKARRKTIKQQIQEFVGRVEEAPTITESEALRESLRQQVKTARIAQREGRSEAVEAARRRINRIRSKEAQRRVKGRIEKATRRTLTELAAETLPVALRGKFLKAIANSTTPKQFGDVAIRLQSAANAFTEAQEIKKNLGSKRSKIAFIRKINEINQTIINEIKKELGIDKPLRQMNAEELENVTEKLKARVRFKRSRGFRPKIEERGSKRTDIPEALYEVNRNIQPSLKDRFAKKVKDVIAQAGQTVEKLLAPISTRLANISPALRQSLRRFEFRIMTQIQKDNRAILPFIKKVQKLSKEDYADLDMALKNGDTAKINELAEANDFVSELEETRKILDAIYERAQAVGYDIGYLENYFPRIIKDSEGFMEFMSDREDFSKINESIKQKEFALGRYLTVEEKANLINNMVRGYSGGQITLSDTGNMKNRIIDFLTPEMNMFYSDSGSALLNYIEAVNDAIESRVFFGKQRPTDGTSEEFNNIEDSIGFYITNLIAEDKLNPAQEKEVRSILTSRFSQRGTTGLVGIYKNLSYLTVMGSPFNAITQIGDLAFSIYAGGLRDSLPATVKAIIGKSTIKKEDIGLERIAAEVQDSSRLSVLVDRVFRLIGLIQIDRVGKEALINSVVSKYQRQARENDIRLTKDLKEVFGNSTEDVIQDLKDGVISEDVKYLAFNEILNFQPIALSEVPEQYLKGGNGRIFYMLKTWTIKMLDVYRNEVYNQMKTDPAQGIRNMVRLTALLMALNATADVLKDLLLGREIILDDLVVDNIAKLIGFSRYTVYQVRREGLGSAIGQIILPPTKLIDDITKDAIKLYDDFEENLAVDKLRTLESIPVIGKLFYWWFGKGSEIKKKRQ